VKAYYIDPQLIATSLDLEFDPVIQLGHFENEVLRQIRSNCPELRESNTQCYIIESENENFFIRDNVIYAVFDEIYSPRRGGGGERRVFYVSPPAVLQIGAKHDTTATFYELMLAKGALILAIGNQGPMQHLLKKLNELVSEKKIITIVKDVYKSGFTLVRDLKTSRNKNGLEGLFSQIRSFNWLPRAFVIDIQFSLRDELTD
jgi:hypothetical protein